jgi:pantoate--beta-alanine ligase
MKILRSLDDLRAWQDAVGWTQHNTGFVPTMGALHDGHSSLIALAAARADRTVVSVLVNPTQFNDPSDFEQYPRTLTRDAEIAGRAGADAVFAPTAEDLYGGPPAAPAVSWGPLTDALEGAFRPGHFDGVVAVVDRLFQAVRPGFAVFGEKDLQQVAVVRRLAQERHADVEIVVGPLVRDGQGLALSSRNARLSPEAQTHALALHRSLQALQAVAREGVATGQGPDWKRALDDARASLASQPGVRLEYLDLVDAHTFAEWRGEPGTSPRAHAVVAAHVGGVRLIDNAPLMG